MSEIIAVWGNACSGKTTISIKLAKTLASMKKNVLIVMPDIFVPTLNVVLPYERESKKSLGTIFTSPNLSEENIWKESILTKNEHISLLSYRQGENIFSHAEFTKSNVIGHLLKMKEMVDYIIVDCIANFPNDMISTVALELADTTVRVGTAELSAYCFFQSTLTMLEDSRWREEEHIKVLSKVKTFHPNVDNTNYNGISICLPYVENLEKQMLEGDLLDSLEGGKLEREYNQGIESLKQIITKESLIKHVKKKKDVKEKVKEKAKEKSEENYLIKLLKKDKRG